MAIQLIDTVTPDIGLKTVADKLNNNFTDPGHAASRLVTSSATDTTAGRLLKGRDFGVGGPPTIASPEHDINTDLPTGFYRATTGSSPFGTSGTTVINVVNTSANRGAQIMFRTNQNAASIPEVLVREKVGPSAYTSAVTLYHTGNTIIDSNGFIKQA